MAVERYDELAALAEVIRAFRRAAGYSQERFAYEAHIDRGFVGAVERGERNIGFRKLRALCVGLGINWEELGKALHQADPLPRKRGGGRPTPRAKAS